MPILLFQVEVCIRALAQERFLFSIFQSSQFPRPRWQCQNIKQMFFASLKEHCPVPRARFIIDSYIFQWLQVPHNLRWQGQNFAEKGIFVFLHFPELQLQGFLFDKEKGFWVPWITKIVYIYMNDNLNAGIQISPSNWYFEAESKFTSTLNSKICSTMMHL